MNVFRAVFGGRDEARSASPITMDEWAGYFGFNGLDYLIQGGTSAAGREEIGGDYRGYVEGACKANGVVFACMVARSLLFSEARFQFRQRRNGRPGDLFGTGALGILESPWPTATTGTLLTRMIQDADIAGNFYGVKRDARTMRRLRPDWVTIVLGSRSGREVDTEIVGYAYEPGGPGSGEDLEVFLPEQVCHFAPLPDPAARFRGMSWITPVLREIMSDGAANRHKLNFFEQGAKLGYVVTLDKDNAGTPEKFKRWIELFKGAHEGGAEKAYKTLFLAGGADVKIVGADLKQIDFKEVQGHGETRICAAARVPPIIVGLSEGLDSATYSNYGQARRAFADLTMRPLWRAAAGALAPLVEVPANAELWYDDRDIPFLQEDMQDAATIQVAQASTMMTLVNAGFDPNSVKTFVATGDPGVLVHTGLVSVQLQPPGTTAQPTLPAGDAPARMLASYIVERAGRGDRLDARDVRAYIESTCVELPPAA